MNAGYHIEAHYVPTCNGSRNIGLKLQPPALQRGIRASIRIVTRKALFETAYPSEDVQVIHEHYRAILKQCASDFGYDHLNERLGEDNELVDAIGTLVSVSLNQKANTYFPSCSSLPGTTTFEVRQRRLQHH